MFHRIGLLLVATLLTSPSLGAQVPSLQAGGPEESGYAQGQRTEVRPFVRFDKTRFVVGEQVFFWVGVSAGVIPALLCDTGRVTFTRPDGSQRVDRSGCPIDGPRGLGWQGGSSLGLEIPQVGRWAVVFEFAGRRSEPASFTVVRDDVVGQIDATFVFSSPLVLDSPEASVTLTVRNRSAETIRFPQRNPHHLVSVRLDKTTGEGWGSAFFVPEKVLLAATGSMRPLVSFDIFTWDVTDKVPTVTVPAGQTYELRLPLAAALEGSGTGGLARVPAGQYDVQFYTLLETLVGPPDGPWKDLSPLRLEVTGTAHGARR